MKKSIIIGTLLIAANTSFAVELHPTTILVEHTNSIPLTHPQTKSATCIASANAQTGFANQPVTVSGYVSYAITNGSTVTQNYWVDEYMCVAGYGCTHVRQTVTLGAHLSGNGSGIIYNTETLPKGNFVDQATIQVTGESNCYTQNSNSVTIK